jgi:hypothetical protein
LGSETVRSTVMMAPAIGAPAESSTRRRTLPLCAFADMIGGADENAHHHAATKHLRNYDLPLGLKVARSAFVHRRPEQRRGRG